MTQKSFSFARAPQIHFGTGKIELLVSQILRFGDNALFIQSGSFVSSPTYRRLVKELQTNHITWEEYIVKGEPSPTMIDHIIQKYQSANFHVVVGIGGGSVLDSAKAVSALLLEGHSIRDYLEGMEARRHSGKKIPFIAIPTTAGTGSEVTKNAVISEIGPGGFKRSFRHENFVPDIAIVDPELTLGCDRLITASSGLDALTQLIEGYVSTESSPLTDALALSGLQHFHKGFLGALEHGKTDLSARVNMSYASMLSGLVLASSGLGTVHGFASSIGGFYAAPHGVICGSLLGEVTDLAVHGILKEPEIYHVPIKKYGNLGRILTGLRDVTDEESCLNLVDFLHELTKKAELPMLSTYGVSLKDLDKIANETSNKNSPYKLNIGQLKQAIKSRI